MIVYLLLVAQHASPSSLYRIYSPSASDISVLGSYSWWGQEPTGVPLAPPGAPGSLSAARGFVGSPAGYRGWGRSVDGDERRCSSLQLPPGTAQREKAGRIRKSVLCDLKIKRSTRSRPGISWRPRPPLPLFLALVPCQKFPIDFKGSGHYW